jgi:hypothetical protein
LVSIGLVLSEEKIFEKVYDVRRRRRQVMRIAHMTLWFYTWFSFYCLGKTSNLTILADLSEQFMRLESHNFSKLSFLAMIPNTWTFNIIIFDNSWNCINFSPEIIWNFDWTKKIDLFNGKNDSFYTNFIDVWILRLFTIKISRIVEYYNIKCSSVWYHFDPITVYYKEKTTSNPNSDTGMNYVPGPFQWKKWQFLHKL